MKRTKWIALMVATLMALSMLPMAAAGAEELSPMVIEVYSQAANFQGEQPGWMGRLLKEKFNVTLNIIAPQVTGSDIFAARSASGFLGDIVLLDNVDIQACIKSGLIYDVTEQFKAFENFEGYKEQLDFYNASLEGVEVGQYYAWPTELTNTGPTEFTGLLPGVGPTLPWDYYVDAGAPELNNLTDLIALLRTMQDQHPTNAEGNASYGITLWPDWDGTSIENVNQLTKWYGQEVRESVLLGADGSMVSLVDDEGAYKRILQFYFDANQAGVVDPDSGTQNWDSVNSKFNSKRAFLIWNDWQQGFWNTVDRGNARENYMLIPVADMTIYQPSDPYYGSGRAFAVGTDDPEKLERVAMILDWMSGNEGLTTIHAGILDFTYELAPDGVQYQRTDIGAVALMDNVPVPDEFGGGLYADGMLQINQWMVGALSVNPVNNTTYDPRTWPIEVERAKTTTMNEWIEHFGSEGQVNYLIENGQLSVVPFVNVSLPADSTDIAIIRSNCKTLVCDASWQMIFAKDQAEFDALWEKLKEDLDGFDWETLVAFDMEKLQAIVDARAVALGE